MHNTRPLNAIAGAAGGRGPQRHARFSRVLQPCLRLASAQSSGATHPSLVPRFSHPDLTSGAGDREGGTGGAALRVGIQGARGAAAGTDRVEEGYEGARAVRACSG